MTTTPIDLERELNTDQISAVTHGDGPQLVLAGAGSGKTRVITYRIAWLIRERDVAPYRIAAVTFTNKAATEMRDRVGGLLSGSDTGTFVGTFHRFAVRLLRRYGDRVGLRRDFAILDTSDQRSLVKRAIEAEQLDESAFPARAALARISGAKSRLLDPNAYEAQAEGFYETRIAQVYRRYQGLLQQASGVDFDDLILLAVRVLRDEEELGERMRQRLQYLLVDEFQDTNIAQLELVRTLNGSGGNLTAVGDEDQGIYRWRGANLDNILRFERYFPGAALRKLERNYRSTQNILDASGALVAHNENRRGKQLWTDRGAGDAIELYRAGDESDEARWLVNTMLDLHAEHRYRDMAVLVRTNAQTRAIEDELLRRKVPYCLIAGVRFYDRAEIKDLVAYLRVVRNPDDSHSLRRILNQPPRGIGKATQELALSQADELGHSIWDVLRFDRLPGVPARGARALRAFRDLILELQGQAGTLTLPELLAAVIERTGYAKLYEKDDPESASRLENLREFVSAAQDFVDRLHLQHSGTLPEAGDEAAGPDRDSEDALTAFLDYVALVTDTDQLDTEVGVSVMTLHAAKGLEFPIVWITGLEDGLLPHFNSQATAEELEEERRLLYVGMTRAERRLLLSTCRRRRIAGRYQTQSESPFLAELPEDLVVRHDSPSLFEDQRSSGVYSFFGRSRTEAPRDADGGLSKGSHVRHATLGKGVVLDLEGVGQDAKLTVFFERAGKRKLLAKFASLEVL